MIANVLRRTAPLARQTSFAAPMQRRFLGTNKRSVADVQYADLIKDSYDTFFNGAITSAGYKKQVESFRLVLFVGVSSFCLLDLMLFRPLKSSYWSLMALPGYTLGRFFAGRKEVFHQEEVAAKGSISAVDAYAQLIANRRLDSELPEDD